MSTNDANDQDNHPTEPAPDSVEAFDEDQELEGHEDLQAEVIAEAEQIRADEPELTNHNPRRYNIGVLFKSLTEIHRRDSTRLAAVEAALNLLRIELGQWRLEYKSFVAACARGEVPKALPYVPPPPPAEDAYPFDPPDMPLDGDTHYTLQRACSRAWETAGFELQPGDEVWLEQAFLALLESTGGEAATASQLFAEKMSGFNGTSAESFCHSVRHS